MLFHIVFTLIYLALIGSSTVQSHTETGIIICAELSTNMGATPTLSSLNENSFTSTIAAFESMHLPLTTSVTDCDHFSTTLVKNTVGSLVPQTTCDELRATKPSSALVPSYVDSSASSIVEASSACDHYTTVTDTNANGELTSQTRCIEYDNVSEIFLVSPSSDSDFMLSTTTNTLGSMTSLVVCAEFSGSVSTSLISDTATSTMDTSQSASTLPPDSISSRLDSTISSSSSDSKTSSGFNFISGRVSTLWETTPTSESSSSGASHSIVSSGSGSPTTSIYSTIATGSSEGMCATGPLPTVSVSMGSGDDTPTASFASDDSLEICNTVNTMDHTAATSSIESSSLPIQKIRSLDTTTSSDQALPSTSELVCAPLAISGPASINSELPAVESVPTNSDASGTALSACPPLTTATTSSDSASSIPSSTSPQVSQASPSVVCDVQQPASADDNLQCVDNSSDAKPMSNTDMPKEKAVCDNGNAPGISSTGSSSSTSNEGACGAISGSPSSSSSSNGSGGASSSSSSSSSGGNNGSSSSSSSSSGGSGGSSSSSSSSSGGGSSSSSSSSSGGGSSSSSSSGGSSSSSSPSSGGQGGNSSSSSSGGGSSSSSSSSFGRSFLAECANPNDCGDALSTKESPTFTNKNARRSSKSRHSSTSSSSTSSTSKDKSGVRSSTTSKSETTTVEEFVIVARSNRTSTSTRIQTESISVENNFEKEGDTLDTTKDKLAINETDSYKLVKRKRLLKRPTLNMKNTKRPRFSRSNRKKYQL